MKKGRRYTWTVLLLVAAACSGRKEAPAPAQPVPPAPQPVEEAALKVGVLVTQRGSLNQYSNAILDGIRIAASEHKGNRVELIVRDDSGRTARSAAMLRELEAAGVVAVIGPMYDDGVTAAANARTSPNLVIIGPGLTQALAQPNTYALNREDSAGAVLLGRYAASLGQKVGVLHNRTSDVQRDVNAFTRAYAAAGGSDAPTVVPFTTGTTTFASHIRKLRDARVRTVYLPLTPREIQQVLPQLGYYGLDGVQVLGGEAWTTDAIRRAVQTTLLNGVVAATVLPRNSTDVAWPEFEAAYQQTYKRSLQTPIPALGYDAARLVLDAAPRGRASAADIARGIARTETVKGATGILHIAPGAASRTPFLVRFRNSAWDMLVFPGAK